MLYLKDATTSPSTVSAAENAILPERHVIAEGYKVELRFW